jgi:hypothetical protein
MVIDQESGGHGYRPLRRAATIGEDFFPNLQKLVPSGVD